MSLKGNFETIFLNSILQLLRNERKTGVLRTFQGQEEYKIFIREGDIIHATGSHSEFRLGNLLKTNGIISESDLEKALAESKGKKQKIGKTLVENNLISSEDLKFYIHKQTEEIMFKLFFWKKGEFEYVDSDIDIEGMVVIQLDILKLILEATRRIDEMSIFKKQIPTDRLILKITNKLKDNEEIKLNANEFRMVALIDGTRNIRDLINVSDYDEFTTYKIIYALICSGLIEKSDEPRQNKSKNEKGLLFITTLYADILQVILRRMEANLGIDCRD